MRETVCLRQDFNYLFVTWSYGGSERGRDGGRGACVKEKYVDVIIQR